MQPEQVLSSLTAWALGGTSLHSLSLGLSPTMGD